MTLFTGLFDEGLRAFSPEYNNMTIQLNSMGEKAKSRGLIGIIIGIALVVLGLALLPVSAGGIFTVLLGVPALWAGYNNLKIGENIKQIAKNPLNYLDEATCFAKISEGTILFDFVTRDYTQLILHGSRRHH